MSQRSGDTPAIPDAMEEPGEAPRPDEPRPAQAPGGQALAPAAGQAVTAPAAQPRRSLLGRLMRRNRLLTDREAELRAREAELLDRMSVALERFGPEAAQSDDMRHFREARESLSGLFLLVIAGAFNSGKSRLINALLGERVLPERVTPT